MLVSINHHIHSILHLYTIIPSPNLYLVTIMTPLAQQLEQQLQQGQQQVQEGQAQIKALNNNLMQQQLATEREKQMAGIHIAAEQEKLKNKD